MAGGKRSWTEAEKASLVRLVDEGKDLPTIAKILDRTELSVMAKYYYYRNEGCFHNVNSSQKRWTPFETKSLKNMYQKGYTLAEISKVLDRKYSSVNNKIRLLVRNGQLTSHKW